MGSGAFFSALHPCGDDRQRPVVRGCGCVQGGWPWQHPHRLEPPAIGTNVRPALGTAQNLPKGKEGIEISLSILADQVGASAVALQPIHDLTLTEHRR